MGNIVYNSLFFGGGSAFPRAEFRPSRRKKMTRKSRLLRALQGVPDNDEALMAGLIIMDPPGPTKDRNFHRDMAQAGDLEVDGVKYSRMQMLTAGEILEGKRFHTPGVVGRGLQQPRLPGVETYD